MRQAATMSVALLVVLAAAAAAGAGQNALLEARHWIVALTQRSGRRQPKRRQGALVLLVAALLLLTAGSGVAARQAKVSSSPDRVPRGLVSLSERSAVHLLERQRGSIDGWNGLCSASKISATELISAKHCFEVYSFPPVPSGAYAENVIGLGPLEYEVASPTNSSQPLLPVTGISIDDDNDLALITVNPSAPAMSAVARRAWLRIPALDLPLADKPPPANTPVVVTSFPAVNGKFQKITWTGHFANRRQGGLSMPNRGQPDEDNVVYGEGGAAACRPGASGSRLVFANGTLGGALWTLWPSAVVPPGSIPAGVIAKNKSDFAGVCSFSVLTDRILRGLRSGFGPSPPPAALRVIPSHMLQGDETPFGFNQVPQDLPQFSGDFNQADRTSSTRTNAARVWWNPQKWNVSVISSYSQLAELLPFTRGALSQALDNVGQSLDVDFITQSLLLVQVTTAGSCCDLGIGRITARGHVVTITVRPKVLGGCFDPPSGPASCNPTDAFGLGFFRLVRIPATALPKGAKFWAVASQDPLPSDHPAGPSQTGGTPQTIPFTSLGTAEDGGINGVPRLTSVLPEFVSKPDVIDNDPPRGSWNPVQARLTVFSSARELNRLIGSLGELSTIEAVGDAETNVDFSKQRLIMIQIATQAGCCAFLASTLTLKGAAADVEIHPIVPTCSNPDGQTCSIAIWAGPDSYYQMITVDRNAFPIPTSFTVSASQIPAANAP